MGGSHWADEDGFPMGNANIQVLCMSRWSYKDSAPHTYIFLISRDRVTLYAVV
jgi:hypothetical protein